MKLNHLPITFLLCIIGAYNSFAQLSGFVKSSENVPLAYATIFIQGSSTGTVSNSEGFYTIENIKHGTITIQFQYLGYKSAKRTINYDGKPMSINIVLEEESLLINELVIKANQEDPAYPIIRKAIQKRSFYKNQVPRYQADLYVKGLVKVLDAPKSILGNDIGTMGGILDSTRQGLVYLSESKSKFYFQAPNKTKEVMISSIKAGSDDLFTANQFSIFSFNLYEEYLSFGRSIISPIADAALNHYSYKLEQSTVDENGLLIHKINVIPKSQNAPLLTGNVYIIDELWNFQSFDLFIKGNTVNNNFLDTIWCKQVFIPIKSPNTWRLFSQVASFNGGLFGFKMGGTFTYIFSNYDVDSDISSVFNNNESFSVQESALQNDTSYWNKNRPIPLTQEESKDYIKKDSLKTLWNSKPYLDSLDRKNNVFNPIHILTGYTYNKSYQQSSFSISSPISSIGFNAVEGWNIGTQLQFEHDNKEFKTLSITSRLGYGFSDKTYKASIGLKLVLDNYTSTSINFSAGKDYFQWDRRKPMDMSINMFASLLYKQNPIRLQNMSWFGLGFEKEVSNGVYLSLKSQYEEISPLTTHSNYSLRLKDIVYPNNLPPTSQNMNSDKANQYVRSSINIRFRPFQKFRSYPYLKVIEYSNWPTIQLGYHNGISTNNNSNNFNRLEASIQDGYVSAKLLGYFSYYASVSSFIKSTPTFIGDYIHPNTFGGYIAPQRNFATFNLLPFYVRSSSDYAAQFHLKHHFNGFIMDKLPLLRKTTWKWTAGTSIWIEPTTGYYQEAKIGIEDIGFGVIKLFDLEYTWAWDKTGFIDHGILLTYSNFFGGR